MKAEFLQPLDAQRPTDRALDLIGDPNYKLRNAALQVDEAVKTITNLLKKGQGVNQDYIDYHKTLASDTLNETRRQGEIDWVEYYRLAIASDYIEERALAPILFQEKGQYPERKLLVNGICGITVNRLQDALADYDRANTAEEENQLYGVCQELTVLAMMNRSQSPSLLAVPSSRFEDRRRKTDIQLYHMIKDRAYTIRVQVKSSAAIDEVHDNSKPTHGFVIVGSHIDNKRIAFPRTRSKDLLVSRALVKLHDSNQPLTQYESNLLESSQLKLDNLVREERIKTRGLRVK